MDRDTCLPRFSWCAPVLLILCIIGCSDADPRPKKNLLLICLDTLRADHLGCYGYPRPTSPFLDQLVKRDEVVLFQQCSASASTTVPSHMTLFTSLYPSTHGVADQPTHLGEVKKTRFRTTKMLAEILNEAGYQTAGIVDGGNLAPVFGLAQGFKDYQCRFEGAAAKVDQATAWLEENREDAQPFFLFLHTYQIHAPYRPPGAYRSMFTGDYDGWVKDYCFAEEKKEKQSLGAFTELFKRPKEFKPADRDYLEGLYDGEIAFTDQELKRLWNYLESQGLLKDLIVVIFSDHGEAFLEHGRLGHGAHVYNEMIRVPLIFRLPGEEPEINNKRVEQPISLVDVMPTLLDLLAIPSDPYSWMRGKSLRPLWEGTDRGKWPPVFSEILDFESNRAMAKSVQLDRKKLIVHTWNDRQGLFDLNLDEGEQRDLADERPQERKALLELLDAYHDSNQQKRKRFGAMFEKNATDPELQDELKQLGY